MGSGARFGVGDGGAAEKGDFPEGMIGATVVYVWTGWFGPEPDMHARSVCGGSWPQNCMKREQE